MVDPYILTATGWPFRFDAPGQSLSEAGRGAVLEAIAIGLSNICRFGGHTSVFYSVAQHSVLVSELLPPSLALQGLMHDAHEAFLGEIPSPLKALLPDYQALEQRIERAVRAWCDLPSTLHPAVKAADLVALATERRDLMPQDAHDWPCLAGVAAHSRRILPVRPHIAAGQWLDRYVGLTRAAA